MTTRLSGFYVALEKDIREDDAENTINAIKQIKGVLSVKPITSDPILWIAQQRVKNELITKILELIEEGK